METNEENRGHAGQSGAPTKLDVTTFIVVCPEKV